VKRRSAAPAPNLTSLLDVLFILVFASLVSAAGRRAAAEAPEPPSAPPPPEAPRPPPEVAALRDQALVEIGERPLVIARVSKDGVLREVQAPGAKKALDVPLTEHVPDPDVAIAYLGDRSAELRVCRQAALHLGVADLSPYLVIIAPDVPLADLTVALASGLKRDADRCVVEQRGVAVVVDPSALADGGGE
jgi:hypothetical protein